jgi:hypothetical protein
LVGTAWKKWSAMSASERTAATHYRLNKVSAVVLNASKHGLTASSSWSAPVPQKPTTIFTDLKDKCAERGGHITADAEVYWYVWNPEDSLCPASAKTTATAKVTTLLPKGGTVYPEYDKLYADKKLDVIVFFGAVEDTKPTDYAFSIIKTLEAQLKKAGFAKGTAAKGLRYTRVKSGITANVDIYTPNEFSGLGDYAHQDNFYDAVNSHEVVIFNGHSMLGASSFWSDPQIYRVPTKYQIFLYNGCLGYEYYVDPILEGKQGAANVDVVSNVIETPFAIMSQESATVISLLVAKAEAGGTSSWQTILQKMNAYAKSFDPLEGAFYGASGARTNVYRPPR